MKDMNTIMLNPIRMRIVQVVAANDKISASTICEKIQDIPRTTIYRHIKLLIDNDILTVVAENRVRGSLERILSLNTGEITKQNTLENATQNAFGFLMNRYARLEKYFNSGNADPGKDRVFMNNTVLMMSDEEFDGFLMELKKLFEKYNLDYNENRRARDISIISAPNME